VTLSCSHGSFSIVSSLNKFEPMLVSAQAVDTSFDASNETMTLRGTAAALSLALPTVYYTSANGYSGTETISAVSRDHSHPACMSACSSLSALFLLCHAVATARTAASFAVTAVNDAPSFTVSGTHNTTTTQNTDVVVQGL
jgi:hypothetical protein